MIYFLVTSQFNKINFNEKILEDIIGNYILSNTQQFEKNINHTKFLWKKIHICILTLDSLKPIFIDLNIDKDNKYLNETFDNVLTKNIIHIIMIFLIFVLIMKKKNLKI